jgi:predicted DNA binding CopG/RHH family protein
MKSPKLPKTDSIQELAEFWDTHDLTDFQQELEEVTEPVFVPDTTFTLRLESGEAEAVKRLAKSRGVADVDLIHQWVREKISSS